MSAVSPLSTLDDDPSRAVEVREPVEVDEEAEAAANEIRDAMAKLQRLVSPSESTNFSGASGCFTRAAWFAAKRLSNDSTSFRRALASSTVDASAKSASGPRPEEPARSASASASARSSSAVLRRLGGGIASVAASRATRSR